MDVFNQTGNVSNTPSPTTPDSFQRYVVGSVLFVGVLPETTAFMFRDFEDRPAPMVLRCTRLR